MVTLSEPVDYRVLIDRVCAASHPAWVDITQRRRWLEAKAELHRTEAAKTQAVREAAEDIGFRFT